MSKEQNKSGHLIDEATKTPRTQAAIRSEDTVPIEFAQQLEHELIEALAEIARTKANYELLRELVTGCYPEKLKDALKENFDLKVKLAALSAAGRGE